MRETYYVQYRNVFRANKGRIDFMKWLKVYWPVQKRWGATSVKLWNGRDQDENVLFCRYTVADLERWNRCVIGPDAVTPMQALAKIVDMDRMGMKIMVRTGEQAA